MRRGSPTLTVTLSTLTVTLVLVSIGAIVAVVSISDRQGREDIELRYGRTSTFAVTESLRRDLAPAAPLLTEARLRVERGLLAVDDPSALADYLVDKVRYQPGHRLLLCTATRQPAASSAPGGATTARSSWPDRLPDVDGGRA